MQFSVTQDSFMKDVQVSSPVYKTKLNGENFLGETMKKAVGRV